jgi:folylpolyglutamate synthase/dihydropteroate synthase
VLVVGARGRRSPAALLAALRPDQFDHVVCTEPPAGDACPAIELASAMSHVDVHVARAWPDAMATAQRLAGPAGVVLVTGSLYLVGAVHGAFTAAG